MPTRRTVLASCATATALTSGCLDRVVGSMETTSRTGRTTRTPVFVDEETGWYGGMFRAEVFPTPDSFQEAIDEDAFSSPIDDQFTDFDPSEFFVTVFASKLKLHSTGTTKGWCPQSDGTDDRIRFRLPLEEWPSELTDPYEELVTLDLWQRNGTDPPSSATIQIDLLSAVDENTRVCPG